MDRQRIKPDRAPSEEATSLRGPERGKLGAAGQLDVKSINQKDWKGELHVGNQR